MLLEAYHKLRDGYERSWPHVMSHQQGFHLVVHEFHDVGACRLLQGLSNEVSTTRVSLQVAKRELAIECDYENELECQERFARLINNDPALSPHFHVPAAIPELSSARVLASEWVPGVHVDRVRLSSYR